MRYIIKYFLLCGINIERAHKKNAPIIGLFDKTQLMYYYIIIKYQTIPINK